MIVEESGRCEKRINGTRLLSSVSMSDTDTLLVMVLGCANETREVEYGGIDEYTCGLVVHC